MLDFLKWQNERPPLPASCQPALAHLIKRCWAANPSRRPDFSYIVSALEKYDESVKEGLPLPSHSVGLVGRKLILDRLKGCVSNWSFMSIHAWATTLLLFFMKGYFKWIFFVGMYMWWDLFILWLLYVWFRCSSSLCVHLLLGGNTSLIVVSFLSLSFT